MCPVDPCTCEQGAVHTQVHNTGCACVRATSNACTVGPERPCNFAPCLLSRIPAPLGQHVDVNIHPKRAGDSDGHYYCIVEHGDEGKEKRREEGGWEELTARATESCRAGFDAAAGGSGSKSIAAGIAHVHRATLYQNRLIF